MNLNNRVIHGGKLKILNFKFYGFSVPSGFLSGLCGQLLMFFQNKSACSGLIRDYSRNSRHSRLAFLRASVSPCLRGSDFDFSLFPLLTPFLCVEKVLLFVVASLCLVSMVNP